jgi:hypothetical protein
VGHGSLSSRALERARAVRLIMARFLNAQGGRALLPPALVRLAQAEHCCDVALTRPRLPLPAVLAWYARALVHRPGHYPAWRGLLTCWWPDAVKARLRPLFGIPEWEARRLKHGAVQGAPALLAGRGP